MSENARKLPELISANEALCEKVKTADKAALIAMAGELGVELSDADF